MKNIETTETKFDKPEAVKENNYNRSSGRVFNAETLEKQSLSVQYLFWAIQCVKFKTAISLEKYQSIKNELLNFRMDNEKVIRDLKKHNSKKIADVMLEHNRLKSTISREKTTLRSKISL